MLSMCVCVCVLLGIFPKASTSRATSPVFKEPFCEKSGPGCPSVTFSVSPDKQRPRNALDRLWLDKELKWVIFA